MDLYYSPYSPPCRAVLMTVKALHIVLNKKLLSVDARQPLNPEFVAISPRQTIPTLVDGDVVLWESRAIMEYLVGKYGKTDTLFRKHTKRREVIKQALQLDTEVLFKSLVDYYYPQICAKTPPDPKMFKIVAMAFGFFNSWLNGKLYVAGDNLSVADFAFLATVSTFEVAGYDFSKYTNVVEWYANAKTVAPGFDENWAGCLEFKKLLN